MKKTIVFSFLFALVLCLTGCGKEAASIGIIGGADGPTAIFVTSNMDWLSICGFIAIMAVIIFATIIVCRFKKKR